MNTMKSDTFVKEWASKKGSLKRTCLVIKQDFKTSSESLFALLCPTTELDWLPGWNCKLLHSRSGYAEYNCIFETNFFGVDEVFVCTRYEKNKAVDYSGTSENICTKLDILLTDNCNGTVTGQWTVTTSALNDEGNKIIQNSTSAKQHMEWIIDTLEHYINSGEMIS